MEAGDNAMNEDDKNLHPWIEPELEARIVAWVLGEASAFEVAELERLIAESPELGVFRQRIEATHRLAVSAVKQDEPALRLSPERRKKLLAAFGDGSTSAHPEVAVLEIPRRRWLNPHVVARIAACLVVLVVVAVFFHSSPLPVLERSRRIAEARPMDEIGSLAKNVPESANTPAQQQLALLEASIGSPQAEPSPAGDDAGARVSQNRSLVARLEPVDAFAGNAPLQSERNGAPAPGGGGAGSSSTLGGTFSSNALENSEVPAEAAAAAPPSADLAPGGPPVAEIAKSDVPVAGSSMVSAKSGRPAAITIVPEFQNRENSGFDGSIQYGSPVYAVDGVGRDEKRSKPTVARGNELKTLDASMTLSAPSTSVSAGTFLAEEDSYFQAGRSDLALKRAEQVLGLDKDNAAARRPMEKVGEQRTANSAGSSEVSDQSAAAPTATNDVRRKLSEIRIPSLKLREATVREVLDFVRARSVALDDAEPDPAKKGVDISLRADPALPASGDARITLDLTDVELGQALDYIAAAANIKAKPGAGTVSVEPISDVSESLTTKEYAISPEFLGRVPGVTGEDGKVNARQLLEGLGVTFPPGATANYLATSGKLIMRNTQANLDILDPVVAEDVAAQEQKKKASLDLRAELSAAVEPFSTFSLHVADVSFQLAKDAIERGEMPAPERIRPEEFYNAVDYGDPAPTMNEQVSCRVEQSAHPLLQQRNLVRIAMKVAATGRIANQPLRLTILLDTSGSMEREDRAASVRRALDALVPLLGPQDRVNLVGFAREPRLLAEQVPGNEAAKLSGIAARTPSEGGTNLEASLDVAGELALKNRDPRAQNRIVLLTDGAANLGNADPAELARKIETLRERGISFDACGVGANGLNDAILEALTRKGDGRYYFLGNPDDAGAGFAKQLAGALRPAAEDVKVQVKFNPARVGKYRLIGFDEYRLKTEDFRDDRVDAAELSADEAAVALYQVEPLPEGEGELGEVFVRFRDPASGAMVERSWTLPYDAQAPAFDRASPSIQLAGVAALLAEKLRGDDVDLAKLAPVVATLRGHYPNQTRVGDLVRMFEQAAR